MALLDPKILELLAQSGEQSKSARPTGLLSGGLSHILSSGLLAGSTFKPRADESWSDRLFGTNDPRDARGDAMMALSTGLLRGSFADGLDGYNRALREGEDRNYKRTASNMALGKNALELQSLITTAQRDQSIRTDLNRLQKDESAERTRSAVGPMLDRQPTDEYGTAGIGGVPMFSMKGPEIFGSQPAATYQPPQPQGAMRGAVQPPASNLTVGTQPSGMGQSRGNYTQGLSNRFVKQAEVYASNGDFERANKLYEQAAKWMPEVHKIEVAMQDNKPVNVITMKDGSQVLSPFSPTPKTHWADTGGAVQAIDEYSMQPRGTFKKSMTPGETASNQVAWANNRNATERLTFDRSQAGKPQLVDGAWHYPPSASNPQGSVIQPQLPAGMSPKLTEVQANATQFATRMRDASNVIDGFEKKGGPWASTVARAGYDPEFPNWMPFGQMAAGAAKGLNNVTVPEDAQRYYQAQTNWVTANLRKESGAAIGKEEMAKDIAKWFPQPGDGADVIAQKTAARRVAEEGMLVQAGPGAKQVSGILDRAGKGADAKTLQPQALDLPSGMNVKELKHGGVYRLPGGRVGKYDSLTRRFTEQ